MKQLTNNLLKMNFIGIEWNNVSKIEIAFSQNIGDTPLKTATYPSTNAFEVGENLIGVEWTKEETAMFEAGKYFYADTRITLSGSSYQPETLMLKLKMNPTLFEN
jgi:hypothetical protein